MPAYYNEFDPYAAQWLRNLIAAGHIAPGIVDERSIEDVKPAELMEYSQCHFFAGIGVWSVALRRAGWPDDRPIWTASCPCQPFSAAGAQAGFDDPRHLWPHVQRLASVCRPPVIIGEQVASKAVEPWIDLVQADMEALDYAFGAVAFPSAGVGAPHIRDRAYWVGHSDVQHQRSTGDGPGTGNSSGMREAGGLADANGEQRDGGRNTGQAGRHEHSNSGAVSRLAHDKLQQRQGRTTGSNEARGWVEEPAEIAGLCGSSGLGNATCATRERHAGGVLGAKAQVNSAGERDGRLPFRPEYAGQSLGADSPGPTKGYWANADWLGCRDAKWRPVEPGTFPLVDGAAAKLGRGGASWDTPAGPEGFGHRAGRLKGYGNAINAEAARVFIEAVMEINS